MSDLQRFRQWVCGFEGMPENVTVDYAACLPNHAAIFPGGIQEAEWSRDILGNATMKAQLVFAVYFTCPKDETTAVQNAEWLLGFQNWVQQQCALGLAPTFGNTDTQNETITATGGRYITAPDDGVGLYGATVTIQYKKTTGV